MSRQILAGCAIATSMGLAHAAQAAPQLGLPPAHWWNLDVSGGFIAYDSGVPGGVPGQIGGYLTQVNGVSKGGVHMPGAPEESMDQSSILLGEYSTKSLARVGKADFTTTFWIRTKLTTQSELLGDRTCYSVCNMWGLRTDGKSVRFEVNENADTSKPAIADVEATVNDGQWHYIVARREETRVSLFVDGKQGTADTAEPAEIRAEMYLGFGYVANSLKPFVGDVDEIRLYDRALADCEILGSPVMAAPLACAPSSECHEAGHCDVVLGTCTDPNRPDGTACSQGVCQAGVCSQALGAGGAEAQAGGSPSEAGSASTATGGAPPNEGGPVLIGTAGAPTSAAGTAAMPSANGGAGAASDPVTGSAGATNAAHVSETSKGCGCRAVGKAEHRTGALGSAVLLALGFWRRRRR